MTIPEPLGMHIWFVIASDPVILEVCKKCNLEETDLAQHVINLVQSELEKDEVDKLTRN